MRSLSQSPKHISSSLISGSPITSTLQTPFKIHCFAHHIHLTTCSISALPRHQQRQKFILISSAIRAGYVTLYAISSFHLLSSNFLTPLSGTQVGSIFRSLAVNRSNDLDDRGLCSHPRFFHLKFGNQMKYRLWAQVLGSGSSESCNRC